MPGDDAALHDVRHRAGLRPRPAPHPDHRQRPHHRRRGPRRRSTSSPAPRSTSSNANSNARCRCRRPATSGALVLSSNQTQEQFEGAGAHGQGAHRRRRHLPGGAVAALRGRGRRRPVHRLPRAAPRQPVALHVLHPHGPAHRSSARRPRCWCGSRAAHVETHPIAGTRPRGRTDEEDQRLAEELKRNEKERAEHVMLVDLGRNDIGRVCDYGTVRVPQLHEPRDATRT